MKITRLKNGNYYVLTDVILDNGEYRRSECTLNTDGTKLTALKKYPDHRLVYPWHLFSVNIGPVAKKKILPLLPGETMTF